MEQGAEPRAGNTSLFTPGISFLCRRFTPSPLELSLLSLWSLTSSVGETPFVVSSGPFRPHSPQFLKLLPRSQHWGRALSPTLPRHSPHCAVGPLSLVGCGHYAALTLPARTRMRLTTHRPGSPARRRCFHSVGPELRPPSPGWRAHQGRAGGQT